MDNNDVVQDDEELYRNVRGELKYDEYSYDDTGKLIIHSAAFRDTCKKPSVDRAKLKEFNPVLAKLNQTNGIVSLTADEVRSIGEVQTKIQGANTVVHAVDVIYDPIPGKNLAHSQIIVNPEFFGSKSKKNKVFKLLQRALARLATEKGWTLEPQVN